MLNNNNKSAPGASKNENNSKKKKGRLKKLLKKSSSAPLSSKNKNYKSKEALTGIVTSSDASELRDLIIASTNDQKPKKSVGPSIHTIHNCGSNTDNNDWQRTEGDHHRQLIQFLLFHSSSNDSCSHQYNDKTNNRKRKRKIEETRADADTSNHLHTLQSSSLSLPSWARVHNLALLDSVVVVEFAIDDDEDVFQMPSSRLSSTNNSDNDSNSKNGEDTEFISQLLRHDDDNKEKCEETKNKVALPIFVDLFQGDRPRHITDVIMYHPPPKLSNQNNQLTKKDCSYKSKYQILVNQLLDLCATPSDLKSNSFPMPSSDNHVSFYDGTSKSNRNYDGNDDHNVGPRKIFYSMASAYFYQQRENDATVDWKHNSHTLFDHHNINESDNGRDPSIIKENNEFLTALKLNNDDNYDAASLISHFSVTVDSVDTIFKDKNSNGNSTQQNKQIHDDNSGVIPPKYFVETCFSNTDFSDATESSISDRFHDNHGMNDSSSSTVRGEPYPHARIFGLDCEMVKTSDGVELARVTLVQYCHDVEGKEDGSLNYKYRVVMDALVKPHLVVLDYVTAYSGITSTMLESVTTRIEDIQATLLLTVYKEDIIIGHSLDNDMRALRWIHPRIVDTSLIFPHGTSQEGNGFVKKYSLRHLSAVLLKKQIQRQHSQKQGHCSVEDAVASLYLALQKAKLGPSFGIKNKRNNRKNIFEKIHKLQKYLRQRQQHNLLSPSSASCGKNNDNVGDDLVSRNYQRPLVCLGPSEWINDHILSFQNAAHALSCESMLSSSVKALHSWLKHNCNKNNRRPFFIWSKLCFCSAENKKGSNKEINKKIDEIMSDVLRKVSSDTLVLFVFQRGYKRAKSLYKQRMAARNPKSTLGWSQKQENEYNKVLSNARKCEAIWVGTDSVCTN